MPAPLKLIFLPGAGGSPRFWQPVADRLRHPAPRTLLGWPGFGEVPPDPGVRGLDDLVALVVAELDRPSALIAQSMGGVIAIRAVLQRLDLVTHLVLTATSGGIDVAAHGAVDWRPAFQAARPTVPPWFAEERADLSAAIPRLRLPTLLLWGDADPISPPAVGRTLQGLLPQSRLRILAGGGHDLASSLAAQVAPLIDAHLATTLGQEPD